jgi:small GTP-binding protein
MPKQLKFKICIFGDKGVGKSTFLRSFIGRDIKTGSIKETIGVDFYAKIFKVDEQKLYFQIWDFYAEERFRFLFPKYMKGANGGIILYDITNELSFKSIDNWLMEFRKSTKKANIPIFLIGNKIDLFEKRAILSKEASDFAEARQISEYLECDATNKKAVEDIFISFSRRLLHNYFLKSISEIFEEDIILKILVNLTVFKELSLTELANNVNKSKSTLSRYTNRLEKAGFIRSFTKEDAPERGVIKTKYYTLIKDLSYSSKLKALSLWIKNIENFSFIFHFLTETQFREAKSLLEDFNSKLEKIFGKTDESKKPYLLINMMFPVLDIINYVEKLDSFNNSQEKQN